jgi:REP element-mobilizing transposase RayT
VTRGDPKSVSRIGAWHAIEAKGEIMADYRRYFVSGGTYFFTLVAERRQRLFDDPRARKILRECVDDARQRWPFTVVAWVLLPDHMHAIWTLPSGDDKYSLRWGWIKRNFTREWLSLGDESSYAVCHALNSVAGEYGKDVFGDIRLKMKSILKTTSTTFTLIQSNTVM